MVKLAEVADEHFEEVAHSSSDFENDDDFEDYESGEEEEENLSETGRTETTSTTHTTDPFSSSRRRRGHRRPGVGNANARTKKRVGGGVRGSMRDKLENESYWGNLGRDKRKGKNVIQDEEEDEDTSDDDDDDDDDANLFEETLMERIVALKDMIPIAHRERMNRVVSGCWRIGSRVAKIGGKVGFVVSTSVLLLGVPYALAVTEEQGLLEMEREMKLQQQANDLISTAPQAGSLLTDGGKKY